MIMWDDRVSTVHRRVDKHEWIEEESYLVFWVKGSEVSSEGGRIFDKDCFGQISIKDIYEQ